ncbi:hypothetical protein WMY93_020588 [Mugilogobius chulae]|uniref:ISXO2-like transposase domain-containing protein n=1 Tax=Mugilogobius chulae TaxID=88201 RepID=A0AAW0NKJ7_9GOBI
MYTPRREQCEQVQRAEQRGGDARSRYELREKVGLQTCRQQFQGRSVRLHITGKESVCKPAGCSHEHLQCETAAGVKESVCRSTHRIIVKKVIPELKSSVKLQNEVHYVNRTKLRDVTPSDIIKALESDFSEKTLDDNPVSQEDLKFLSKLRDNIKQNESGHFEFRAERPKLPDNKVCAMHRLKCLEKRLRKDKTYYKDYRNFMDDIISRGDAEKVPDEELDNTPSWYIPHHGVYHPHKPGKIRVVFDASAKYQDTSLNDHLLTGPDLTNTLVGVLCRFRKGSVAFTCDIERMFHQFHVTREDQDYLRFLWWEKGDLDTTPSVYRMKVHLFGAASSPGCANFGLKHLAAQGQVRQTENIRSMAKKKMGVWPVLRLVEKRGRQELVPLIAHHVKPGSMILSDEWRAYRVLPELGYNYFTVNHSQCDEWRAYRVLPELGYNYFTVNHSQWYVDPVTGTHTQHIEKAWRKIKEQACGEAKIPGVSDVRGTDALRKLTFSTKQTSLLQHQQHVHHPRLGLTAIIPPSSPRLPASPPVTCCGSAPCVPLDMSPLLGLQRRRYQQGPGLSCGIRAKPRPKQRDVSSVERSGATQKRGVFVSHDHGLSSKSAPAGGEPPLHAVKNRVFGLQPRMYTLKG